MVAQVSPHLSITGRLATGIGLGRHFTRLDWARRQFVDKLCIDPYPGTINLILDQPEQLSRWTTMKQEPAIRIDNPGDGPQDCDARCWLVTIEGRIAAAIVLPEVASYAPDTIELISAVAVRDALRICDGDQVTIELR